MSNSDFITDVKIIRVIEKFYKHIIKDNMISMLYIKSGKNIPKYRQEYITKKVKRQNIT